MLRFCQDRIIAFDVDDTLIRLDKPKHLKDSDGVVIDGNRYWLHYKHIEKLKEKFNQGFGVLVWSQSGDEWADKVIRELKLENFVHLAMTKPEECVDDIPVNEWMKRSYIKEFKGDNE